MLEKKLAGWFNVAGTVAALAILLLACAPAVFAQTDETASMSPAAAKRIIQSRSRRVITALQTKNLAALAGFVHPVAGVRFSPYSSVDKETDLVFTAGQVKRLATGGRRYHWGDYDGSGDPIRMTFNRYYRHFVYDRNFASAPRITFNDMSGSATIVPNLFSSYPGAIVVDYYFPGKDDDSSWRSLRLVFQKREGVWYLVGIVHNEWTI